MAELLNLPRLPEGYVWKVDVNLNADYEVEVYRRRFYTHQPSDDELVVSEYVKNTFGSLPELQKCVNDIASKLNRAVQLIDNIGATT